MSHWIAWNKLEPLTVIVLTQYMGRTDAVYAMGNSLDLMLQAVDSPSYKICLRYNNDDDEVDETTKSS